MVLDGQKGKMQRKQPPLSFGTLTLMSHTHDWFYPIVASADMAMSKACSNNPQRHHHFLEDSQDTHRPW
jgi:hypothetical protein